MIDPDLTGARPSNAGDEFHELWALQQALGLLDHGTELQAVYVEGLQTADEKDSESGAWEGVDCAFYYGGDTLKTTNRIVINQLKYATSEPEKPWTVARLCSATNKKKDNSVVARLASAFAAIRKKRPDLEPGRGSVVRLVSNQPVASAVIAALTDEPESVNDREKLRQASGLDAQSFESFAKSLDFSKAGASNRYALDDALLSGLASLTEDDARASRDELMRWIRTRMMMPDRPRDPITRADLLFQLAGSSDPSTLFPCEPALKRIDEPVPRETAQVILARMRRGTQRLAIVGEGGCGKTTVLFEIEKSLPTGSEMVKFDCYGAGSYLDSDAHRHRPREAFLQLTNELSRQLRTPLLVSKTETRDWPRTFKRRLVQAAELVAARNPRALLVIAIDAADNAITAAEASPHGEHSFVPDFVGLGDLPANVRLLVSARLGRIESLALPERFERHELGPFTLEETAAHARTYWPTASKPWIEDLHALSGGNPRVQAYALDQAGADVCRATEILRPDGKSLDSVFRESFEAALLKGGRREHLADFCAALIGLARPAPVRHVAAVTELNEAQVRDLVSDLRTGGLRLVDNAVGFADEDLEHFVREAGGDALPTLQARIAEHLFARRRDDEYAAMHVAHALLAADRRADIVDLAREDPEPHAIADPVQRRAVQLQRLRTATKVCREAGNVVHATMTILAGAEAVRADAAVTELLLENPDLAVRFAPQSASHILRDPEMIQYHGPLLMHRMAEDSRSEDGPAVREGFRRLSAWYRRRDTEARKDGVDSDKWTISSADNAAVAEALCRTEGPGAFQRRLRRWPRSQALELAVIGCGRIAAAGDHPLLEDWLASAPPPRLYRFVPLTHLALAGFTIEIEELLVSLERVARVGLIDIARVAQDYNDDDVYADLLDLFVTGCEILFQNGASSDKVTGLLDRLLASSVRQRGPVINATQLAIAMRAHAICETAFGRTGIGETFLVDNPDSDSKQKRRQRHDAEILVAAIASTYATRAELLAGNASTSDLRALSAEESYRLDGYTKHYIFRRLRGHAAVAAARLCHIPGIVGTDLAQHVLACAKSQPHYPPTAGTVHLAALALRPEWHAIVLTDVAGRVEEIKQMRTTAGEKSTALARLVRILASVSKDDAQAVFEDAVKAAGEADSELAFALETLTRVVARGTESMTVAERRSIGAHLTIATSDIGLRLDSTDVMPWGAVTEALVRLDPSVALAALARWDDEGLVHRRECLSSLLMVGLKTDVMTAERASALTALMEHTEPKLISAIAKAGQRSDPERRKLMAEELARDECLYHGRGERANVVDTLQSLGLNVPKGGWMEALEELALLNETFDPQENAKSTREAETTTTPTHPDPLATFDWQSARWTTPEAIEDTLDDLLEKRKEEGALFSRSDALERMAVTVTLGERCEHLEAIVTLIPKGVLDWEPGHVLNRRLAEWKTQPAIARWRRQRLPDIISDSLPAFCRGLAHGYAALPDLLEATESTDSQIRDVILSGIEKNVDHLDAPTLYLLVGVIAEHVPPEVAAMIATGFVERLLAEIPKEHRTTVLHDQLPSDPAEATARFLYALMSDVEVPLRWRAAHAVRRLARLGDAAAIDALAGLLDRRDETNFRDPDAPFYWLSARLWLLVAIDRVADEAPHLLAPHARLLLAIATAEELPHVLMRSLAASAVMKLANTGAITLSKDEKTSLAAVNTPALPAVPAPKATQRGFGHVHYDAVKDRQHSFDTMDTVPYWYGPASAIFAEVTSDTFLDVAETFIVKAWTDGSVERAWDRQPRVNRLSRRDLSTMHRHGSLPSLERWDTHLEWHAMFCTVGALLRTHSVTQPDEFDDYDTLSAWLGRQGLTAPPEWLSDLLAPKPAEPELWREPANPEAWFSEVTEEELSTIVGLDADSLLVVAGRWNARTRRVGWNAEVMSALVSPDCALDLLSELASKPTRHDYYLPLEKDEHESEISSSQIFGWVRSRDGDLGLDEHDPLRNGISGSAYEPGKLVNEALGLTQAIEVGRPTWHQDDGHKSFVTEEWGELAGDQDERLRNHGSPVSSHGNRLRVASSALLDVLEAVGLDLILEVTHEKYRNGDDGRPSYLDDENRRDRTCLYLLRRDGSLYTPEGAQGTWVSSKS